MYRLIFFSSFLFIFISCENASEVDNDRDLIDEEKVQKKYQEVKEDLKDADEELDSAGKEIKEEFKEVEDEIDEEI